MLKHDLTTDEGLRAACEAASPPETPPGAASWRTKLAETLEWLRTASEQDRATRESQERLWERNEVAAVGQGNIPIDRALDDYPATGLARATGLPGRISG